MNLFRIGKVADGQEYIAAESMSDAVAWYESNVGACDSVEFVSGVIYLLPEEERNSPPGEIETLRIRTKLIEAIDVAWAGLTRMTSEHGYLVCRSCSYRPSDKNDCRDCQVLAKLEAMRSTHANPED